MSPHLSTTSEKESPNSDTTVNLPSLEKVQNHRNYIYNNNNNKTVFFEAKNHPQNVMSSPGFYPGVFLPPPTFTSTPSINRISNSYPLPTQPFEPSSGDRNSILNGQNQYIPLTESPILVLNKLFAYLSAQDLRAFHQVSHTWKSTLESRIGDNNRRLELVRKIRENKENFQRSGLTDLSTPELNQVNRMGTTGKKSEAVVLIECTNLINTKDASSSNDNRTENPPLTNNSCFAFHSFEEAERSLKKGQKLFRCRRCAGPVPSPILSRSRSSEEQSEECNIAKIKINATRCRLTSRREAFKSRTFASSIPAQHSPSDISATAASTVVSPARKLFIKSITTSSFSINCLHDDSISDYFNSACSIIRDESKSYFPEISVDMYEMNCRSLNESAICKTQSLENMTDYYREAINVSDESSVSCPNLNESFTLECPNPSCSFRFCSTCSIEEHPGRSCHVIDSESFEKYNVSTSSIQNRHFEYVSQNITNSEIKSEKSENIYGNLGSRRYSGSNNKDRSSKKSLRRIAKLG